jgi:hypothetical protein
MASAFPQVPGVEESEFGYPIVARYDPPTALVVLIRYTVYVLSVYEPDGSSLMFRPWLTVLG